MGIENIKAGSIVNLQIAYNTYLSDYEMQSICDYLTSSYASSNIHDNAPGCNSQQEVEDACAGVGIPEVGSRQHVLRAKPEGSAVSSFPNPCSDYTLFEYKLPEPGEVSLTIFNHLGQQVAVLVKEEQACGKHQVQWDAEGVPAGMYYYRLTVIPTFAGTGGKVMVVRLF
ncbi:MAG TPA: T9SS type A sorting domain-containing protein [Bacteroidales bacterium]|nr:T9SS type A sorting domain-containing protein [Bacteroidales bacterium]HNS45999.1 T9SS type A sorting domain-containing protein [Bacteroidales bacterium]